jgi:hypothetical protein
MTIAGRLPGRYAERNLKTGSRIRMGSRDTVPFAQYKDSDTLWAWPKNTHLDKIKMLHRVSIPRASTNSLQDIMLQHASIDTFIIKP